jgi:hypothetical protein
MFMLYHSKGCNICESVLHECYVNDLYTTTCSGVLGLKRRASIELFLLKILSGRTSQMEFICKSYVHSKFAIQNCPI